MLLERRKVGFAAMLAAGAIATGCGSNDNISVADAKKNLVSDCVEDNKDDQKLCICLADELEKKGLTGKRIDDVRKEVNDGKMPKEIGVAAVTCGLALGKKAAGG